jgi:hypothetical protein
MLEALMSHVLALVHLETAELASGQEDVDHGVGVRLEIVHQIGHVHLPHDVIWLQDAQCWRTSSSKWGVLWRPIVLVMHGYHI